MKQSKIKLGRPSARKTDPITSWHAWYSVRDSVPERQMKIANAALQVRYDGFTSTEMADALSMPRDSVSPRLPEMEDKGLLVRTGGTRKPIGYEGTRMNKQTVWVAAPFVRDLVGL